MNTNATNDTAKAAGNTRSANQNAGEGLCGGRVAIAATVVDAMRLTIRKHASVSVAPCSRNVIGGWRGASRESAARDRRAARGRDPTQRRRAMTELAAAHCHPA